MAPKRLGKLAIQHGKVQIKRIIIGFFVKIGRFFVKTIAKKRKPFKLNENIKGRRVRKGH